MIKIYRFKSDFVEFSEKAFKIRRAVFVGEQHVEPTLEFDQYEAESHHYLVIYKDLPVGAARWRFTEKGIKLERFAILKDYRNLGIGSKLLKHVMKEVLPYNQKIYLHAQLRAVPYYKRYGFIPIGEIFEEADIQHYYMEFVK